MCKKSILGGTFDHFHIGHESFIKAAFLGSLQVTVGIVKTPFSNAKSFSDSIEPYETRLSNVSNFLEKMGYLDRTTFILIHDIYGTALSDKSIESIYVTSSTKQNAILINEKRESLNMPLLEIVEIPHIKTDDGQIVSSSLIRAGLIDRFGDSFLKIFKSNINMVMPESIREQLQKPMGIVVEDFKNITSLIPPSALIFAVGDIVSMELIKACISPAICIIDFYSKRKLLDRSQISKFFPTIHDTLINKAGTINPIFKNSLLSSLEIYLNTSSTQIIKVEGEEDLLTLPTILLSPLNSYVIYGMPNKGACIVKVTSDSKKIAKNYLMQFKLETQN